MQKGILSIALNADWREPLDSSASALAASQRSLEFTLGWLADPIYLGDYPAAMRKQLGARLPSFTAEQRRLLLNSTDFFALQHYSTLLASHVPDGEVEANSFYADERVRYRPVPGARKNVLGWDIAPFGFGKLLKWVHRRYSPAGGIVVTENGLPLREDSAEQAPCHAPCHAPRHAPRHALCHAPCHAPCISDTRRAPRRRGTTRPARATSSSTCRLLRERCAMGSTCAATPLSRVAAVQPTPRF